MDPLEFIEQIGEARRKKRAKKKAKKAKKKGVTIRSKTPSKKAPVKKKRVVKIKWRKDAKGKKYALYKGKRYGPSQVEELARTVIRDREEYVPPTEQEYDLKKATNAELTDIARSLGLHGSYTKDALIKRIIQGIDPRQIESPDLDVAKIRGLLDNIAHGKKPSTTEEKKTPIYDPEEVESRLTDEDRRLLKLVEEESKRNRGAIPPPSQPKTRNEFDDDDEVNNIIRDLANVGVRAPPAYGREFKYNDQGTLEPEDPDTTYSGDVLGYGTRSVTVGVKPSDKGMSDREIDHVMSKYPEYLGCVAYNEIATKIVPKVTQHSRGCFVYNTESASKAGEHWRACYFDGRKSGEHEIDIFDSYGDPMELPVQRAIKLLADKINSKTYLKLKENRVRKQGNSSNCGWFCCQFLIDRLNGKKFVDASGWNDAHAGEKSVEQFKSQQGFGYIYSGDEIEPQEGGVSFHKTYPPSVQRFLTDEPVTSIIVGRKPIIGGIDKALNLISLGRWNKGKKELGYRDMFHLFLLINGNVVLERNHVVTMYRGSPNLNQGEQRHVPLSRPTTFKELLMRTERAIGGEKLNRYDPADNNCQVFVRDVLRSNGILTPALSEFIMQDSNTLIRRLPGFTQAFAKFVTDTAHKGDVLINGRVKEEQPVPSVPSAPPPPPPVTTFPAIPEDKPQLPREKCRREPNGSFNCGTEEQAEQPGV